MYARRAVTRSPLRPQSCHISCSKSSIIHYPVCSLLSYMSFFLRLSFVWCPFNYVILFHPFLLQTCRIRAPSTHISEPVPNICTTVVDRKAHAFLNFFGWFFESAVRICAAFDGNPTTDCPSINGRCYLHCCWKCWISCYPDAFLLSFNNVYFNRDENSIIQTPILLDLGFWICFPVQKSVRDPRSLLNHNVATGL